VALILGSLIAVKLMKAALRLFLLAAAIGGFALVYVIFFR
jgi:hypothetical protein